MKIKSVNLYNSTIYTSKLIKTDILDAVWIIDTNSSQNHSLQNELFH